jgi:hypothetical protein
MSALSPLDPHPFAAVLAVLGAVSITLIVGRLIVPGAWSTGSPLQRRAIELACGLLFIVGVTSTITLGRFCYWSVLPLLQVAAAVHGWRRPVLSENLTRWTWREVASIASLALACLLFTQWHLGWLRPDGELRAFHSDLGYFIQIADQLPHARVANGWTAVIGEHLATAPGQHDTWYHWGPLWLAVAVKAVTGLPAITSLLIVTGSVLNLALVLAASAVAQSLCRTNTTLSLIIGAASLVAVQWLRAYGLLWIVDWFPNGIVQHMRWTLAQMFSYKFEGVLLLTTLLLWLEHKTLPAVLLLFCAGVSAPHTVGAFGAMAGTLGFIGVVTRKPELWKTSATTIAALLAAWAMVSIGFGAGLPKAEGQHLIVFEAGDLLRSLRAAVLDTGIGFIVGGLSLPGIVHLIRAKDERATERMHTLGWMAMAGIIGPYAAYSFLHSMADRFHFITLMQAALVLPVGVWGAARMASQLTGAKRIASIAVIVLTTGMGVHDLNWLRASERTTEWKAADVAVIRSVLQGKPFGFFAKSDRQWWIPKHNVIASMLESRCVRLNDLQRNDIYTRYYGTDLVHDLVPRQPPETSEAWSLRLAAKLGIHHVLELAPEPLPEAMKPFVKEVAHANGLRLFELTTPAP